MVGSPYHNYYYADNQVLMEDLQGRIWIGGSGLRMTDPSAWDAP
jgi:hypothetical protein